MTQPHFAIIVSRFNESITNGLLNGAIHTFTEQGVAADQLYTAYAPGAFEIPIIAKKLAESGRFAGIVCLGCVIKGETAHFEYISEACSQGIMQVMLETGIPIHFGVLTTYTRQQAEARCQLNPHNKGRETAAACLETYQTLYDSCELIEA
jgi:6,7-dimethyl-8-ribityllumazine synthase